MPGWWVSKIKIYISEPILDSYEYRPIASYNEELHDLTLIKMNVARFVGTGGFWLIRGLEL